MSIVRIPLDRSGLTLARTSGLWMRGLTIGMFSRTESWFRAAGAGFGDGHRIARGIKEGLCSDPEGELVRSPYP